MKICSFTENAAPHLFTADTDLTAVPAAARHVMSRFATASGEGEKITRIEVEESLSPSVRAIFEREEIPLTGSSFALTCEEGVLTVFATGRDGVLNGLMTFLRLLDGAGAFSYRTVCDGSVYSFRGIKILMPARAEIPDYRDFVDMMRLRLL